MPEHCRGYGAAEGQFGLLVLGPCCAIIGSAGCRWLLGSAWLKEAGPYVNHRLLSFLPAAAVQMAEVAASTGFDKIRALSAAVRYNSVVVKSVPGQAEEVGERPMRVMTGGQKMGGVARETGRRGDNIVR